MEEDKQLLIKTKKNRSYPLQFKLDAFPFAQIHGNRTAERKFNVDRKRLREWREKIESIEKTVKNKNLNGSKRMRIKAAGRKPFIEKLDESVLE